MEDREAQAPEPPVEQMRRVGPWQLETTPSDQQTPTVLIHLPHDEPIEVGPVNAVGRNADPRDRHNWQDACGDLELFQLRTAIDVRWDALLGDRTLSFRERARLRQERDVIREVFRVLKDERHPGQPQLPAAGQDTQQRAHRL